MTTTTTTTTFLLVRVTGDCDQERIRTIMDTPHPPTHHSGPWYTLKLDSTYDDDEPREITARKTKITIVRVTENKPMENILFMSKSSMLPPNVTILDEHEQMLCAEFEQPPPARVAAASTPSPPESPKSATSRACYMYWDIENCLLKKTDDVKTVTGNILQVVQEAVGHGWTPRVVRKSIYVDPTKPYYRVDKQIRDLEDFHWDIVNYTSKGTADTSIQYNIDMLVAEYRDIPAEMRPIVCLITGDRDFSVALAKLKMEGWTDIVLIHTAQARNALKSQATYAVCWEDVRAGTWPRDPLPRHIRDFLFQELSAAGADGKPLSEVEAAIRAKCEARGLPFLPEGVPLVDLIDKDAVWVEQQQQQQQKTIWLWQATPVRTVWAHSPLVYLWLEKYLPKESLHIKIKGRDTMFFDITAKSLRVRDEEAERLSRLVSTLLGKVKEVRLDDRWNRVHVEAFSKSPKRREWDDTYKLDSTIHVGYKYLDEERKVTAMAARLELVGERTDEAVEAFHRDFVPTQCAVEVQADKYIDQYMLMEMTSKFGIYVSVINEEGYGEGEGKQHKEEKDKTLQLMCFGFEGDLFAEGVEYLRKKVSQERVRAEYVIESRRVWLYLTQFEGAFYQYMHAQFGVTMGRAADSFLVRLPRRMAMMIEGSIDGVDSAVSYLNTNLNIRKIRTWSIDIPGCYSHKFQCINNLVNRWHIELSHRQRATIDAGVDPLGDGSAPVAFVSLSPPPPRGTKIQNMTFPVEARVEVWMHENHAPALYDEITKSFTDANENFCYRELKFDNRMVFTNNIMAKIGPKNCRDRIYQEFGVNGVTWDYEKATVQVWGIKHGCVDRACAWITTN